MSFRVWFRRWIRSFFKLLTVGTKKYKSDAQRKKERERRLKAKYSSTNYYWAKKKRRKRRRTSYTVHNERLIRALFEFMATSLGILFLPFGLFHWGYTSHKAKALSAGVRKGSKAHRGTGASSSNGNNATSVPKKSVVDSAVNFAEKSTEEYGTDSIVVKSETESIRAKAVKVEVLSDAPDENTPKSVPKNENDRYIRKRMIIAGSSYSDKAVLDRLNVGTYFSIEAEPDNPYDKNAVKFVFNGEKIGYAAKSDQLIFLSSLRARIGVYGVITEIKDNGFSTQYEYEAWFDSAK